MKFVSSSIRFHRVPSPWLLVSFLGLLSPLTIGCSVRVGGSGKTSADAKDAASSKSDSKSSGSLHASASGSSQLKGQSSTKGSGSGSTSSSAKSQSKANNGGGLQLNASATASHKSSSSTKFEFKTKERVSGIGKASTNVDFKGTYLISGKGSLNASGKVAGSTAGGTKTDPKPTTPVKTDPKKDDPKKDEPKKDEPKKDEPKKTDPKPTTPVKTDPKKDEPTPQKPVEPETPVIVPVEPPEEPPENVFGYEQPVLGCFEGLVYPIAANSQTLPKSYEGLEAVSVLYACEWDIPARDWSQGFPGVEQRFEWFAIRYSGKFRVSQGGKWSFRISSDDGSKLYVDGKLVITNDGVHPPKVAQGTIELSEGDHEMVLEYFQGPRYYINLQLFATPPGGEEGIFSVR